MKRVVKMLGIIALVAIIGTFAGCGPADPDDQTYIAIDLPGNGYDGAYAAVVVYDKDKEDAKVLAYSRAKEISGSFVSLPLFKKDTTDAIVVEKGLVALVINTIEDMESGEYLCPGSKTETVVNLGKGEINIPASKFIPPLRELKKTTLPTDYNGTYKATYKNKDKKRCSRNHHAFSNCI